MLLADGGRRISGLAVLRDRPELFGPVASTATAWRVLDSLDAPLLSAVRSAQEAARERLWAQRAETVGPIPDRCARPLGADVRQLSGCPLPSPRSIWMSGHRLDGGVPGVTAAFADLTSMGSRRRFAPLRRGPAMGPRAPGAPRLARTPPHPTEFSPRRSTSPHE